VGLRRKFFGWEPKRKYERALSSCEEEIGIQCWSSTKGALELAVFLQRHTDADLPLPGDEANVRIACRSWHPVEFMVTREFECEGGTVADHDPEQIFRLIAGRVIGRRHRSYFVGDGVRVTRSEGGAKVEAVLKFVPPDPVLSDTGTAEFSLSFPGGGSFKCLCC
jgi:hypothetical protein